jgi:hypothetical protein
MENSFKRFLIIAVCLLWGIITYFLFPWARMAAKDADLFSIVPSILIQLSCSLNQKICVTFAITSNFHRMINVPLSFSIQLLIYLIIGIIASFAKPRRKKEPELTVE